VEVSGHTDSDGDDASNLDLSQRRSDAVKRYLEGKGVKAERLVAVGYGETKPIDKNSSSKGKANNRRVEFNLVDQANPTGPIETKPAGQ
jgi:outer membrane protein OmpA-like peptidoglycan-associated protein